MQPTRTSVKSSAFCVLVALSLVSCSFVVHDSQAQEPAAETAKKKRSPFTLEQGEPQVQDQVHEQGQQVQQQAYETSKLGNDVRELKLLVLKRRLAPLERAAKANGWKLDVVPPNRLQRPRWNLWRHFRAEYAKEQAAYLAEQEAVQAEARAVEANKPPPGAVEALKAAVDRAMKPEREAKAEAKAEGMR